MLRVTCTKHETVTTHDLAFESPCEFDELIKSVRTVAPESDYPDLYLGGQRLPAPGSALQGSKGWRFALAWTLEGDIMLLCESGGNLDDGPWDMCYTYSSILQPEHDADGCVFVHVDAIATTGRCKDVCDDTHDDSSSPVEVVPPVAAAPTEESQPPLAPRRATAWWHRVQRPPCRGAIPPPSRFFPLTMSEEDAFRFEAGRWLTTTCVELGLQLIQQRLEAQGHCVRVASSWVVTAHTLWCWRNGDASYLPQTKRLNKARKLFEREQILLFPIHVTSPSEHWMLLVADGREGRRYFGFRDSCSPQGSPLNDSHRRIMEFIRDWIIKVRVDSPSGCWDGVLDWPFLKIEGPTQANGFDCGMHLLVSAHVVVEEDARVVIDSESRWIFYDGSEGSMRLGRYSMHAWILGDACMVLPEGE